MRPTLLIAAALALGGCGGGSPEASVDVRRELEQRLARSSIGVCDGDCVTYEAEIAACDEPPVALEGRDWYRCRVEYRPRDGEAPAPDEICAAVDDRDGYVARPVEECARP